MSVRWASLAGQQQDIGSAQASVDKAARRIGFARGQIRIALEYLDGRRDDGQPGPQDDRLYWCYKALVRALAELEGKR